MQFIKLTKHDGSSVLYNIRHIIEIYQASKTQCTNVVTIEPDGHHCNQTTMVTETLGQIEQAIMHAAASAGRAVAVPAEWPIEKPKQ